MSAAATKLAQMGRTPVLVRGLSKHSSDRMAWKIPGTTVVIERWVKRSVGNVAKSTRTTQWLAFETKANRVIILPEGIKPHEVNVAAWIVANLDEIMRGGFAKPQPALMPGALPKV